MCIVIDWREDTCGKIAGTPAVDAGQGETVDIGKDTGAPVTRDYTEGTGFPGVIRKITITLPEGSGH